MLLHILLLYHGHLLVSSWHPPCLFRLFFHYGPATCSQLRLARPPSWPLATWTASTTTSKFTSWPYQSSPKPHSDPERSTFQVSSRRSHATSTSTSFYTFLVQLYADLLCPTSSIPTRANLQRVLGDLPHSIFQLDWTMVLDPCGRYRPLSWSSCLAPPPTTMGPPSHSEHPARHPCRAIYVHMDSSTPRYLHSHRLDGTLPQPSWSPLETGPWLPHIPDLEWHLEEIADAYQVHLGHLYTFGTTQASRTSCWKWFLQHGNADLQFGVESQQWMGSTRTQHHSFGGRPGETATSFATIVYTDVATTWDCWSRMIDPCRSLARRKKLGLLHACHHCWHYLSCCLTDPSRKDGCVCVPSEQK